MASSLCFHKFMNRFYGRQVLLVNWRYYVIFRCKRVKGKRNREREVLKKFFGSRDSNESIDRGVGKVRRLVLHCLSTCYVICFLKIYVAANVIYDVITTFA